MYVTAPDPVHRTDQESVLNPATSQVDGHRDSRRRHRATIVAAGLVLGVSFATLGYLAGASRAQDVRAEAVVLVTPLAGNPFSPDGQGEDLVNLQSEAQLVKSDAVATLVARREDSTLTAERLLDGVSVEVPPNTQILTISYTATSAASASERAQAFASEYLRFRQDRAEALVAGQSSGVESQIEEQNRRLRQLVAQRNAADSDSSRQVISTRIDAATAQIAALRGQLAQFAVGSIDPGQVVTPASATRVSGGPPLALGGALVGALLGVLAAALAARRWWGPRPVRRPDDLLRWGLPVVAEMDAGPSSPAADGDQDDVRELRAAVLARLAHDGRSTLVLVAPLLDGAPRCAEALAWAMARSSVRTVVVELVDGSVECDPSQGGVDAILRRTLAFEQALVKLTDDLWALPRADGADGGGDLDVTPTLRRVLDESRAMAELVIVAGPALSSPEGIALLERADLALIEIDEHARLAPEASAVAAEAVRAGKAAGTPSRAVWIRRAERVE